MVRGLRACRGALCTGGKHSGLFCVFLFPLPHYVRRAPPPHSSVFIQVYGSKGKTVPIPIRNKTDNFERNKEDVFDIEFANVGRLYKLRVWHDDKCVACMQAERQACPCPVCSWYKLTHPVA